MDKARPLHVLVIDNHDSFVYTIVGYLEFLGARVRVIRATNTPDEVIDGTWNSAWGILPDAVLVSPGPGSPHQALTSQAVITACAMMDLPMLGVCLGHQVLAELYGAAVLHAPEVIHGGTSDVTHDGVGLYFDLPQPLTATRYHSLAVDPNSVTEPLRVTATADDGTVMGLAHLSKPLVGVQYHPESVLSEGGYALFANWLAFVAEQNTEQKPQK